jgi:hypothetical protein
MLANTLAGVIGSEFDKNVGRFQCEKEEPTAMHIEFRLHSNYDIDPTDCYRHLKIRLFAEGNYVTVLLHEDEINGNNGDYETGWLLVADHDSCWRDGLQDVLRLYETNIAYMDTNFQKDGWYTKHPMTEAEIKEARELVHGCYRATEKLQMHAKWEPWLSRLPLAEMKVNSE